MVCNRFWADRELVRHRPTGGLPLPSWDQRGICTPTAERSSCSVRNPSSSITALPTIRSGGGQAMLRIGSSTRHAQSGYRNARSVGSPPWRSRRGPGPPPPARASRSSRRTVTSAHGFGERSCESRRSAGARTRLAPMSSKTKRRTLDRVARSRQASSETTSTALVRGNGRRAQKALHWPTGSHPVNCALPSPELQLTTAASIQGSRSPQDERSRRTRRRSRATRRPCKRSSGSTGRHGSAGPASGAAR